MPDQPLQTDEWLELVLEHSSDAIIIIDHERIIRYANRAAALLGGVPAPGHLIGVNYGDVLRSHIVFDERGERPPPEAFPSNRALAEGVTTRGWVVRQIHKPTGRQSWHSISSVPLYVDKTSRQARFAIVFFTDISDQKIRQDRVEFLLKASRMLPFASDLNARLLEKALAIVPLMADWCTVHLVEHDGIMERVTVVHRDSAKEPLVEKFARLAYERGANTGGGIREVIRTGAPKLYPFIAEEALAEAFPTEEGRALVKELRPCSAMILPIISGERTLGILSLAYTADSGRAYSEDDLEFMQEFCHHFGVLVDNARLYQEVEKRDKAKDAFIAALSHELRNPLAPIKSSLELLAAQNTDPSFAGTLETIKHQFDHLNALLRDLLDVTRFTREQVSLEKKPIDLRKLIERTIAANHPFLEEKGITLHASLPEEPLPVEGDETRLQQALMNILHNAEKFTPPLGNVWIEARREDDTIRISIRDDGEGMTPETVSALFDPYAPVTLRTNAGKAGLGLGLVLVREIVRLHGGEVRALSEGPERGSTFEICLPHVPGTHGTRGPQSSEGRVSDTAERILVVDDNEAAARGLDILLRHHGHETALAYCGEEALEKMHAFDATTVLLDIGLPDMSGYDVARRIREEYGDAPRLIALTGYGQFEDIMEAERAGFNHHLVKPAGIADILDLLDMNEASTIHTTED